jgi:integrase
MHLRRLPSGAWQATVKVNGYRKTATAKTKGQARQRGAELLLELGGKGKDAGVTVADMLLAHLAAQEPDPDHPDDADRWSPTYHHDATAAVDRLIAKHPTFCARRLRDVTPEVLLGLYRELDKAGWTRWRMKRIHTVMGTAWKMAVAYGWANSSPCALVAPPTPREPELHPPTAEQVAAILAELQGPNGIAVRLNATLGIRRGDLVAIRWDRVDLDRAQVLIDSSIAVTPGKRHVMPTKSGKRSPRQLALDLPTGAMLKRWRAEQAERAVANGVPMVYVFSDDAGVTPWRPDRVSRMFRRVADRAGAEGVRLHDLRHFVATTMLEDGEPLHEVAGQLGNTMKTTEEKYRHYMPGRGRESVDRRAARLGG